MKMRKIIAVLAAALMLCTIIPMGAISVSAAAAVYSEDFEDGTLGTWSSSSGGAANVVAAADLPVANPNGGNYAMQTVVEADKYPYLADTTAFTVEANTNYMIKVDVLHTSNNWPVEVIIGGTSWLSDTVFKSGQTKVSNAAWTTLTYIFNSGSKTNVYMGVKSSWANCTVYFDNISVTKADASTVGTSDGYIYNGDFETGSADPWSMGANASVVADPTGSGRGYVVKADEAGSGAALFGQVANNLKANTNYKLTFKVYCYNTVTNNAFWVQFPSTVTNWSVDVGSTGMTPQTVNSNTARINVSGQTGAWYDLSITFNTGDLTSALITFLNYRTNYGQYYFDNIKLREVKAPSFDGYITNGDFETGDLTGWTVGAGNVAEENGNTILQGTATAKYGNFVHQIVNVEANTEYAISFKVKGAVSGGIARLYAGTGTGNTGAVNTTYTWNVSNTAWTNITVSFNSGANTQLYINLCQGKDNGGDIYYDDILMWELKDPSYDGYLYNGDFETGVKGAWNTSGSTTIDTAAKHDGNFGAHLSVSSASWGGMLNQTITGLEPGATYSITFWYKVIQQGVNWKVAGETIGTDGKAVALASNYVTAKEWTQVSKEFVADGTTALINFSGSGITESKSTYENGIDEMYVDSVVITLVKAAACEHEYKYDCDKVCSKCGEETRPEAQHEYMYPCDAHCMICYELTNENAAHNTSKVDAVEATCEKAGNVEYWTCADCGGAWLDEACTIVANQMNVIVPATGIHTYDNDFDVDCNVCGDVRAVVAPATACGFSCSEDVRGLAVRFEVPVSGMGIDVTTAIYDDATVNGYKLISMGAIASNGVSTKDIPAVYLCDDDVSTSAKFAIRIINIPEGKENVEITFTPYIIVEIDGVETTIYGEAQTATYDDVLG